MADLGGVLRGINMGVTVLSAFMFFKADLAAAAAAAFAPLPFLPAIGKSISYRQKKKKNHKLAVFGAPKTNLEICTIMVHSVDRQTCDGLHVC